MAGILGKEHGSVPALKGGIPEDQVGCRVEVPPNAVRY